MVKISFLFFLPFLSNLTQHKQCEPHQTMTEKGCLQNCSSPQFSQCPDVFTMQFAPNFCALNDKGEWSQFTYQCQACNTPGMVGVKQGQCNKNEQQVLNVPLKLGASKRQKPIYIKPYYIPNTRIQCSKNTYCQNWQFCSLGKCFDNCARMRCRTQCKRGQCLKSNFKTEN